ncbi:polysaccharide deacetylase family protein [Acetobacterium bakii]|uniref:Polysaccharide deacetylase n=1 Tax=Acetobacterium bakii TaxID=52689 RepID=A0A0L6U295_9FIRM|nr:polysaccharide deacetylase family protein [Acetobacterium bakii]KNZ41900.1 polysaccharide deacetylase [Acetobacterium bakii]
MKRKSKLKIKSLPRFVAFTLMSLPLILMIPLVMATLITKVTPALNGPKKASEIATQVVEVSQVTATEDVKPTLEPEVSVSATDPLETIKIRLRSGETKDIKVVFLTLDDGPSEHTGEVLDILKKHDIKATFFTTLHQGDTAKALYRRIVNEGHTLANHSSTHNYDLYNNPEAFYADVKALDEYQRQVTGLTETSHVFRFPGGSMNANETCARGIVEMGFNYADWNVSSGDGSSTPPAKEIVAQNIIKGCRNFDISVVLCHAETKPDTRSALSTVIETLKAEGYTFMAMEKDFTYPRQLEV